MVLYVEATAESMDGGDGPGKATLNDATPTLTPTTKVPPSGSDESCLVEALDLPNASGRDPLEYACGHMATIWSILKFTTLLCSRILTKTILLNDSPELPNTDKCYNCLPRMGR